MKHAFYISFPNQKLAKKKKGNWSSVRRSSAALPKALMLTFEKWLHVIQHEAKHETEWRALQQCSKLSNFHVFSVNHTSGLHQAATKMDKIQQNATFIVSFIID